MALYVHAYIIVCMTEVVNERVRERERENIIVVGEIKIKGV